MSNLARFTQISRKIVAVGRNYAEHAAELGNAVPSKPLLFMKVRITVAVTRLCVQLYAANIGLHRGWATHRDSPRLQ